MVWTGRERGGGRGGDGAAAARMGAGRVDGCGRGGGRVREDGGRGARERAKGAVHAGE